MKKILTTIIALVCVVVGFVLMTKTLPMPGDLIGGTELDFEVTSKYAMGVVSGTTDKAEIRLSPGGWIDRKFVLGEGQVGLITFAIKGKSAYANEFQAYEKLDRRLRLKAKPEYKMLLELVLPKEVQLIDVADGFILSKLEKDSSIYYKVVMSADFDMTFSRIKDDYNWWRTMGLLIESKGLCGSLYKGAKAWMTWEGARFTNVESFDLEIREKCVASDKLKHFYLGCSTGGIYPNLSDVGWNRWTSMMVSLGLNAMQPDFRDLKRKQAQLEILRKNGVDFITPIPMGCPVYDGYKIGDGIGRPESDKFVSDPITLSKASAGIQKMIAEGVCPSSIYERRPYFMNHTVKKMAEVFKGWDGIWCNWEPFAYTGRGCYCDCCRKKFAEYIGKREDEVKNSWPKSVQRAGEFEEQFVKFASIEHGKAMRVIREEVEKVCGKDKPGFIPGVAWCEMASMWRTNTYLKMTRPYDYAAGFKWISPWGPYAIYPTQQPYEYSKWRNLRTFLAAKDVREQVNKDYPKDVRPKLMGYAHGLQLQNWICYPEALEMNIDSFFFNGWEALSVYHFPRGYDQRWLAAFTRSAEKVIKYEDFVVNGLRIDNDVELRITTPFAAPNSQEGIATRGLDIRKSMLQYAAYEKDGKIIVATFNFWEKGPVFFKIFVRDRYIGEFYCGALRTKVWELNDKRDFDGHDITAWKREVYNSLVKAAAEDAEFESSINKK